MKLTIWQGKDKGLYAISETGKEYCWLWAIGAGNYHFYGELADIDVIASLVYCRKRIEDMLKEVDVVEMDVRGWLNYDLTPLPKPFQWPADAVEKFEVDGPEGEVAHVWRKRDGFWLSDIKIVEGNWSYAVATLPPYWPAANPPFPDWRKVD